MERNVGAQIEVKMITAEEFRVRVTEGKSETRHTVTMKAADYERLSGKKVAPAEFVRRAFEFLLARESKEQILSRFDITVIGKYFREFESTIQRSLGGG
jgi:hypothetical protein